MSCSLSSKSTQILSEFNKSGVLVSVVFSQLREVVLLNVAHCMPPQETVSRILIQPKSSGQSKTHAEATSRSLEGALYLSFQGPRTFNSCNEAQAVWRRCDSFEAAVRGRMFS